MVEVVLTPVPKSPKMPQLCASRIYRIDPDMFTSLTAFIVGVAIYLVVAFVLATLLGTFIKRFGS